MIRFINDVVRRVVSFLVFFYWICVVCCPKVVVFGYLDDFRSAEKCVGKYFNWHVSILDVKVIVVLSIIDNMVGIDIFCIGDYWNDWFSEGP